MRVAFSLSGTVAPKPAFLEVRVVNLSCNLPTQRREPCPSAARTARDANVRPIDRALRQIQSSCVPRPHVLRHGITVSKSACWRTARSVAADRLACSPASDTSRSHESAGRREASLIGSPRFAIWGRAALRKSRGIAVPAARERRAREPCSQHSPTHSEKAQMKPCMHGRYLARIGPQLISTALRVPGRPLPCADRFGP